MTEIVFTPEAVGDLAQIKSYIAEELGNDQAAVRTVSRILGRIRTLADFPLSGTPLSSIVDFETDYRFLVCGNYLAFYRMEGSRAGIVRILYGRRNFMKILFGEPKDE